MVEPIITAATSLNSASFLIFVGAAFSGLIFSWNLHNQYQNLSEFFSIAGIIALIFSFYAMCTVFEYLQFNVSIMQTCQHVSLEAGSVALVLYCFFALFVEKVKNVRDQDDLNR